VRCPTPHKKRYRTAAKARKVLRKRNNIKGHLEPYQCRADNYVLLDHFHLGGNHKRTREQYLIDTAFRLLLESPDSDDEGPSGRIVR
jgi:hypothetical protein